MPPFLWWHLIFLSKVYMKTYMKKRVLLANNETYQMDYDARINVRNTEASASVNILLKPDECSDYGIIEKDLAAGLMKQSDVLLPKGLIKASGGTVEVLVWY